MSNTKVFKNKWMKYEMFSIYEVNEQGEKKEKGKDKPFVSFGLKKAKIILAHIEELKAFVKENE